MASDETKPLAWSSVFAYVVFRGGRALVGHNMPFLWVGAVSTSECCRGLDARENFYCFFWGGVGGIDSFVQYFDLIPKCDILVLFCLTT